MSERTLYEEYLICKVRDSHVSDGYVYTSNPPKSRCKFCRTWYWTETIHREADAPSIPSDKQVQ